jgi:hypothetical protein
MDAALIERRFVGLMENPSLGRQVWWQYLTGAEASA